MLCGLGFSKGPVNILQWMSERASKPGRNRPSDLSSRDLYTAVSLITAAEEGKNGELCCHFWNEMTEA